MIRVVVAEDSQTAREFLVELLRSDAGVDVVGEAADGNEAVALTKRLRPDVVTMDLQMPRMDGFEATRRIMVETPTPIVIVSASIETGEVAASMHALRAGALTVLSRPQGPGAPDFESQRQRFVETIKAMSQVKVVRRWASEPAGWRPSPSPRPGRAQPRIVAIAASTGGPAALARILSELPGGFSLPVVVVQHIARGFLEGFASWLNTTGALPVKVARDGAPLAAGSVYVAPDDRHLGVSEQGTLVVSSAPPIDGFRPSASYLFESVARTFGSSAIALVLTGMGRDGVTGLRALRASGGQVFAQDEASSVVFGMPGAAAAEGLVDQMLPLDAVAGKLRGLADRSASPQEAP